MRRYCKHCGYEHAATGPVPACPLCGCLWWTTTPSRNYAAALSLSTSDVEYERAKREES